MRKRRDQDLELGSPSRKQKHAGSKKRWRSAPKPREETWIQRGRDLQLRCDCGQRSRPARKNLYLVLDDWAKGFSIHKINTYRPRPRESNQTEPQGLSCLPQPAMRLAAPEQNLDAADLFLAPMGDRIVIAAPLAPPAFAYAAETGGVSLIACLPEPLLSDCHTAVAIGDVVYVLSSQLSFAEISWASTGGFCWKAQPSPPFGTEEIVTAYAVHPNEHTIFMSTSVVNHLGHAMATYSFDTRRCEWMRRGDWALPFKGQGFFDSDLDAWVGLHKDGYICCCDVASTMATLTKPNWVMGNKKMFRRDSSAALVCMGENKFCLVESVKQEGLEVESAHGEPNGHVLHLTIFYPRYNTKGELKAAIHHSTCSYLVSRYRNAFPLAAFWM